MNVRSIVRLLLRGGPPPAAALLLLGASAAAGAQSVSTAASQQANAAPTQLQEVIVTAEKRRQPLLEAPVSVTVVSGQALEQRHEVKLADYLAQIPGISVQDNGYGQVDFSIRGIGSSPNLAPTVGVEVDGVPIGSSNAAGDAALKPDIDPNDMANIQVLYGPQGTLYGDDAMGGLIEYTTVKPDLESFSGRVEADTSTVQGGGVGSAQRAMVNLPIIDGTLGVRITGFLRHDPGFIDDVESGQKNVNDDAAKGGRVDMLWQIASNASLRLNALAQDGDANGDAEEILNSDYQSVNGDLKSVGRGGFNGFQSKYRFYTGTLDIDLGWAHLLSLSGYNTTEYVANLDLTNVFGPIFGTPPFVLYPLAQDDRTNKFSQEIRLTSPSNQPLEWIGGLYYTREQTTFAQTLTDIDTTTGQPFAGFPTSVLSAPLMNPPTAFHDYAGYVTLTYHFSPKFDLEAGGRYTSETTDVPYTSATGLIAGAPTPASSEKDDATTFLASARYHLSPDQMAYLRVASGFRPGGSNGVLPGVPPTYGPDKTVNYELGYKAAYLDRRLELETALFYIDWTNIQLEALNEYDEGFTVNGNKARSQGAQFEQPVPDRPWLLGAALAHVHGCRDDRGGAGQLRGRGRRGAALCQQMERQLRSREAVPDHTALAGLGAGGLRLLRRPLRPVQLHRAAGAAAAASLHSALQHGRFPRRHQRWPLFRQPVPAQSQQRARHHQPAGRGRGRQRRPAGNDHHAAYHRHLSDRELLICDYR